MAESSAARGQQSDSSASLNLQWCESDSNDMAKSMISLQVVVVPVVGRGTKSSPAKAPKGQIMQGSAGAVGQQ